MKNKIYIWTAVLFASFYASLLWIMDSMFQGLREKIQANDSYSLLALAFIMLMAIVANLLVEYAYINKIKDAKKNIVKDFESGKNFVVSFGLFAVTNYNVSKKNNWEYQDGFFLKDDMSIDIYKLVS